MERRLGRVIVATAMTTCSVIGTGYGFADPLTDPLYHFYGDVTDPLGRAVSGASVSDGAKSTTSDSLGAYRLGERDVNKTFRLTAGKAGMDPQSRDVTVVAPIDTRADFTLQYRTSVSLRDTTLSGVSGDDTVLDITTYAPLPGLPGETGGKSCVTVTDSGAGVTTNATFAGFAADGAARWEWPLTVALGDPERSGTLTAKVATCDSATALGRTASTTYVIDNTPVSIADIQPKDGSTTAHSAAQVVSATIRDLGGSGVDPASIVVDLVDTTTGVRRQLGGVSYNATTARVTTAPVSVTLRHRHRVEITAADRSGNALSFGQRTEADGGFYASEVVLPKVDVAIPETSCTLSEANLQKQEKTVTCVNVVLNALPDGDVTVKGSGRTGSGFVEVTAPIQNARVSHYVGTTKVGEVAPTYQAGVTGYTHLRYDVTAAADTDIVVTPAGRTAALGTVTATVPMTATSAKLAWSATGLAASASTCANPAAISGAVRCVSDPFETGFAVAVKAGESAAAVSADHAAKHGVVVHKAGTSIYLGQAPNGAVAKLRADARVAAVARDVEYDYKVSFATLKRYDVTATPLGAESLANGGSGATGDDLRVYDLTLAAGIPDDGFRHDTATRQNVLKSDSEVGLVEQDMNTDSSPTDTELENSTVYSIESTVGTAGRASTTNGASVSGDPAAPGSSYRWIERSNKCGTVYDDNRATVTACGTLSVAGDDGNSTKDYYALYANSTSRSKAPWNLKGLTLLSQPTNGNSGWEWHSWSPGGAVQAEPCRNVTVSVGYQSPSKGWSIELSTTKQWCEKYDIQVGSPGNFTMTWKGNVEAESRGLYFYHIVKVPQGQRAPYTVKAGYSYAWF